MANTRSAGSADPAATTNNKPSTEQTQIRRQPAADKTKPKPKPKPKVPAADTSSVTPEHSEAPVKPSRKRKAPQAPAPNAELSDDDITPSAPAPKRRNKTAIPPCDPLPDRGTARQDIGGPDRKRPKRTTAQVQEEKAQKEKKKQQLEDLKSEKLKFLAEMELEQARLEAEEEEEASAARGFENEFTRASLDESPDEELVEVEDISSDDAVASPAKTLKQIVRVFSHIQGHITDYWYG